MIGFEVQQQVSRRISSPLPHAPSPPQTNIRLTHTSSDRSHSLIMLEETGSDENSLQQSGRKEVQKLQRRRNPFDSLTNSHERRPKKQKQQHCSTPHQTPQCLLKPFLKQNRVSQETRASEIESVCNQWGQKSRTLQLAEELQAKARLLDERISAKLKEIKQQFWHNRAKSCLGKPIAKPKQSLGQHLRRKHSEADPPEALMACYMKFIPMREVIEREGETVSRRVAQWRLSRWLQREQGRG